MTKDSCNGYCCLICSYILVNGSESLNFFLHKYADKYVWNNSSLVFKTHSFRIIFFTLAQVLSMFWVWAPLCGSTKLTEWLTVSWDIFSMFIRLYALHSSEITVVPGLINSKMIGTNVAADLSLTSTMKASLLSLSTPPKTQCPSV